MPNNYIDFSELVSDNSILMEFITRHQYLKKLHSSVENYPVTALVGPRQSGKTTLARAFIGEYSKDAKIHYMDLENPRDLAVLDNPLSALEPLHGLIVLDEIQRKPDLFPLIRVLADRTPNPAKFLILGSASGELMQQTSESLAGRIAYWEVSGFDLSEIDTASQRDLWLKGGFPKSFLSEEAVSFEWREQFIQTFVERDLFGFGVRISPSQFLRFWQMAAHYHGQIVNFSEIGRSLNLTDKTIRNYMDILTDTFLARQLQPWFENAGKRIVKSPKFYIRDTGILHALLGISSVDELLRHPKLGASWEGFALEQTLRLLSIPKQKAFFWSTYTDAEIDLFLNIKNKRVGIEFKYSDAPQSTRSMTVAMQDLALDHLCIVYPGNRKYEIKDKLIALPLADLPTHFSELLYLKK